MYRITGIMNPKIITGAMLFLVTAALIVALNLVASRTNQEKFAGVTSEKARMTRQNK